MSSQTVSSLATFSVNTLAISLEVLGGVLVFAPQQTSAAVGLPISSESKIYVQMSGGRLLTLGWLLLKAQSELVKSLALRNELGIDSARRDLRRGLHLSLAWDTIDLACLILGFLKSEVGLKTFAVYGGGATCGLSLAGLALRAV